MKRISSLMLAFLLLWISLPASAEQPEIPGNAEASETTEASAAAEPEAQRDSLTIGNVTPMRGQFFTDMWGNSTSDLDVRDLLHGYNLVMWDEKNGMFTTDPSVVSGMAAMTDTEGNHTYVMVLYDDLYYSDGSRITAWDYAFSYLFSIAPEVGEIGGVPVRFEQLLGYREYMDGKGPLAGVRVLADNMISVTLNHEYLPFFYEMGLLSCNPYPISVIAPGVTVRDDGQGVYLANLDETEKEPLFTAENLQKTVTDPERGYLSHPSVVSGPYTLTGWDGTTAEFEINPYYKGNAKGQKPAIRKLTYTLAFNDTMAEKLVEGEFDLLNKIVRQDQILDCLGRMTESGLSMSNYPRMGMSYVGFACEKATVASVAVRQALALCMDRDQITADYVGAFGMRVDGYYGVGQWMYGFVAGTREPPVDPPENPGDAEAQAAYEATLAAYEELSLDALETYAPDTNRAIRILEADGWMLNEDGVREKDGVTLDLKLLYPEGNEIADSLQRNWADHLAEAGIRLTMAAAPMNELLTAWYAQDLRDADMFYMGSNFDLIFDPSAHFQSGGEEKKSWSYTQLEDEEMYAAALAMRTTEPGDVLTYLQNWIRFQERFNAVLPMIPVYSNVYFDFYTDALREYAIEETVTWGQAIVGARIVEPDEMPEEETEEDEDDFEFVD